MRSIRNDNLLELFKGYLRNLNIGQIILGVSCFFLTIWCAINVSKILHKYLLRETIISLENNWPNVTAFPGITICAPSIIKPQVLAHYYPEFANQFYTYNYQKRHNTNASFDTGPFNTAIRYDLLRKFESKALNDFTAEQILTNISVRPEDLLISCTYTPINIRRFQISTNTNTNNLAISKRPCTEMKAIQEIVYENRKCITLLSDLEKEKEDLKKYDDEDELDCKPSDICDESTWSKEFQSLLKETKDQMIYSVNPSIDLVVRSIENDIWHAYVTEPITITVHPSNAMLNRRDSLLFSTVRSDYLEIAFTAKTTILLEPPNKTMCVKYYESAHFVAEGIKNRDECINRCINSHKSPTCANYYSVITLAMVSGNQTICDHEHQNYTSYLEARDRCEDESVCPAECETIIYELSGELRDIKEHCSDWTKLPSTVDMDGIPGNSSEGLSELEDESEEGSSIFLQANYSLIKPKLASPLPLRLYGQSLKLHSRTIKNDSDVYYRSPAEKNPAHCNSQAIIRISPRNEITVKHQTSLSFENFLGNIGGHIGIWLGLSLYTIIKVSVHLLYNLLTRAVHRLSPNLLSSSPGQTAQQQSTQPNYEL